MDKSTQTETGEGNAPRVATQRTIDQWFAYQDRTIGEIHALNMELQSVKAQRDELLAALSISTTTLDAVLAADPKNIAAKCCIERNKAAIAKAEGGK